MNPVEFWIKFSVFLLSFKSVISCGDSFHVIGASGISSYIFLLNEENATNPTLNLTKGCTYTFLISFGGSPFFIKDPRKTNTSVTGNIGAYIDGISSPGYPNIGVQNGTLNWIVNFSTPDKLFYQCEIHSDMWGLIYILEPDCGPCDPIGSYGECKSPGQCSCLPEYTGPNCTIELAPGCVQGNATKCDKCVNNSFPLDVVSLEMYISLVPREFDFDTSPPWLEWEIVGNNLLIELGHVEGWDRNPNSAISIVTLDSWTGREPRGIRRRMVDFVSDKWFLPMELQWYVWADRNHSECNFLSLDNLFQNKALALVYFDINGTIWPTQFKYSQGNWYHLNIQFYSLTQTYSVGINGVTQKLWNLKYEFPLPLWNASTPYIYFGHFEDETVSELDDITISYGPACGCCTNCWDTSPYQNEIHCCPLGWTGVNCTEALGLGCATGETHPATPPPSLPPITNCSSCYDPHAAPNGPDCVCSVGYYRANPNLCSRCNCSNSTSNSSTCSPTTGQCNCTAGYYGLQCNQTCSCNMTHALNTSCAMSSGQCYCMTGYGNRDCSKDTCNCPVHSYCADPNTSLPLSKRCVCNAGYTMDTFPTACLDIDACRTFPCTGVYEVCVDLPAPSLNSTSGRRCDCNTGSRRNNITNECEDVNACIDFPCALHMSCYDLPPPAPFNVSSGRNCSCNAGYTPALNVTTHAVYCEDVNACTWYPCEVHAQCQDLPAPALNDSTGRECRCPPGYYFDGMLCQNVDACLSHPCDTHATCDDLPPPAPDSKTGRHCNCTEGYIGDGEISDCEDGDACLIVPCDINAVCFDLPAPAPLNESGRVCTCVNGYTGDGDHCFPLNPCEQTPCPENATCEELAGSMSSFGPVVVPPSGRTCTCPSGQFYIDNGTGTGPGQCQEIDACIWFPCVENATCLDLPAPNGNSSEGRDCECNTGYAMNSGEMCEDINACDIWPCDSLAECTDLPAPAPGDVDGRTCVCILGYAGNGSIGECWQATACQLGEPPSIRGSEDCGNHSSCQFVIGYGAECVCHKGYTEVDEECQAAKKAGTTRVHVGFNQTYNVTVNGTFQNQFIYFVVEESKGRYEQFVILQILVGEDDGKSVIEMDILAVFDANSDGNSTSNTSNFPVPPMIIISRLQLAITDSQSNLSQMGVTYVLPLDEPMAPADPAPRRTRPTPPSSHDVWELILAVVLAIIIVAIARALQIRYFNHQSGSSILPFVRPADPD